MSKGKTFSRTYRFSGQTIGNLLEVQQQRDFPSITLALETIIAEAYESLKEKPLPLVLRKVLGDELYNRHIEWLEQKKEEGEALESIFRRFIQRAGMNPTKEEWLKSIQEGSKVDPFKILEPTPCHYRNIIPNPKNPDLPDVWCDEWKKFPITVCIRRQERHLATGRICKPEPYKKKFAPQRKGRDIEIPTKVSCPYRKGEVVSIREVCYNKDNPCNAHRYCRSLDYYKTQLDKKRKRGEI